MGVVLAALMAAGTALTGKTAREPLDGASVTAAVKANLAAETVSTIRRIDVDSDQGIVYLTGTVEDAALKRRAAEIAREVSGVRAVLDTLRVQRPRS